MAYLNHFNTIGLYFSVCVVAVTIVTTKANPVNSAKAKYRKTRANRENWLFIWLSGTPQGSELVEKRTLPFVFVPQCYNLKVSMKVSIFFSAQRNYSI